MIFLVKGNVIHLGTVQLVVLFVGIPILAHLLISGLRQFLYLISPRLWERVNQALGLFDSEAAAATGRPHSPIRQQTSSRSGSCRPNQSCTIR
ncbi:MAG: hypothetical protein M0C28_43840 [Candidatus Moduliflexus flocculans]|nr:hypothetical protein [Candidatus Moduliflexus flocculans]